MVNLIAKLCKVIAKEVKLFGKELFIRFTASVFRKLPSIYVFSYFPFGFEGRMWDLIVSVPDHCLSFYLTRVDFFFTSQGATTCLFITLVLFFVIYDLQLR